MGHSAKPEGGDITTALAVTKDDMAALTPAQRAAITERKNANIVSAQIAGTNWGKGLDATTQRAIADWGQRQGVDVTTEIHVLGGAVYLNAQFYINRGIDLINRGKVLDYRQRFIHPDDRLDPNDPADAQEIRERRHLCIRHGVPATAKCVVLTEIVLTSLPHSPFYGVKWTPHPTSQRNDPVGAEYPQETALTRSARRAWKQAARQIPEMQRWVDGAEEDAVVSVNTLLEAAEERALASTAAEQGGQRQLSPSGTSSYVVPAGQRPVVETVSTERTPEQRAEFQRVAAMAADADDPFATSATAKIETPFDLTPIAGADPARPVTENLFGEHAAMEPAKPEPVSEEFIDDTDQLDATERAELLAIRERNERRKNK